HPHPILPPPPRSTLFPYTTLFRSLRRGRADGEHEPSQSPGSRTHRRLLLNRPISRTLLRYDHRQNEPDLKQANRLRARGISPREDRKSTRLNSSHSQTSYAVFCLK